MRKKHGITPKIPRCSGPNSRNEQTPTLKVPLQTELRFHSRGYEQPPHRRARGTTNSGRLASDLCSSSDGPRTDAAAGRLSFASPLKGREPDIKAKEPEVGPRVALTVSSAKKLSPTATTSAPTAASTYPPTPHQRAPQSAPAGPHSRPRHENENGTVPEHEYRPRGVRRVVRPPGAAGHRHPDKRRNAAPWTGQQQFAFPGTTGGRLLRRAGGWFPPPEAEERSGTPATRRQAPARLALLPSKDDEEP
jgi:hypothetical protein